MRYDTLCSTTDSAMGFKPEGIPVATKWSFITRNVIPEDVAQVSMLPDRVPVSGDLILATVEGISQHPRIQLRSGRRSLLYPGDTVVVAMGNRYAPDQFEAFVPQDLSGCHLVAAGGIVARVTHRHSSMKPPTRLRPEGYCMGADGEVLNLNQYTLAERLPAKKLSCPVIAVLGTSMNSGKTTTAAALVRGFTAAGYRVAAIKATGTGAGNDLWAYEDCGAALTLDFTDAGYPSTYKLPADQILECFETLLGVASSHAETDLIVIEIADGLLHPETSDLVSSVSFQQKVSQVIFSAGEAMGAIAGVERLNAMGICPVALSGVLSASKLSADEAVSQTGIPVMTKEELGAATVAALVE